MNSHANDAMIRRLEKELEERNVFVQGLIANAQDGERDLNEAEKASLSSARDRMGQLKSQLDELEATADLASQVADRARVLDQAITVARKNGANSGQPIEYRSAGGWLLDMYKMSLGDRQAAERIEVFSRAAAHQKTTDNLGVVPDPIVGGVLNFIDSARPLVSAIGVKDLPGATFHRPKITQGTVVDVQGAAGAAADEKAELDSQKMTITRLTANAVTYGGYVNVSRQNIDFTSPQILDIVINDLAARYAIKTEAAVGTELDASTAVAVGYGASPTAATITAALWAAAEDINTAIDVGGDEIILAVAPDRLAVFGPLFPPVNVQNGQSEGLFAGRFGQGVVGGIAGVRLIMSKGLASGKAFLFSTAAIEVYEQRIGTLQAVEPSVLGVQVAYAGYFTPLTIEDGGIIELTAS